MQADLNQLFDSALAGEVRIVAERYGFPPEAMDGAITRLTLVASRREHRAASRSEHREATARYFPFNPLWTRLRAGSTSREGTSPPSPSSWCSLREATSHPQQRWSSRRRRRARASSRLITNVRQDSSSNISPPF